MFEKIVNTLKKNPRLRKWIAAGTIIAGLFTLRIARKGLIGAMSKSPPQLHGLPIVGSLFTMLIWKNEFREKLLPRYGDLVSYNLVNLKFYKINEINLLSKVFKLAYRRPPTSALVFENVGAEPDFGEINNDNNKKWEYRRKKFMSSLTKVLNSARLDENLSKILEMVTFDHLDSQLMNDNLNLGSESKSNINSFLLYPRELVRNITFNVIYLAMFGKILKLDDKVFNEYNNAVLHVSQNMMFAWVASMSPYWMNKVSGLSKKEKIFQVAAKKVTDLIRNDYRNENGSGAAGVPSLAQCYRGDDNISQDMIIGDFLITILGGTDTTAHAVEVGMLLLAKYPKIQEILYNELKTEFGDSGKFSLSKVLNVPQFRAFIFETLRIACPSPDETPRMSKKDIRCLKFRDTGKIICEFADSNVWKQNTYNSNNIVYDYIIEKGCIVEGNLSYLLRCDKSVWNDNKNANVDPSELNLNHWLKYNGKENKYHFYRNKNSIPFGIGARECPGQSLAMKEMYVFFGNLILKYQISEKNNNPDAMQIKYSFGDVVAKVEPQIPLRIARRPTN